jgi:hypothetical protein
MTKIMDDGRVIRDGEVDWTATRALQFERSKTRPMFLVQPLSHICKNVCSWFQEGTCPGRPETCDSFDGLY